MMDNLAQSRDKTMDSKAVDLADSLNKKTAQLDSLLSVASSSDFHDFSDAIKSDYLWACSELSESIRNEFDTYDQLIRVNGNTET